jgi:hypothetical protein
MTVVLLSEDFHNRTKIILSGPVYRMLTTDKTSRMERQMASLTNKEGITQIPSEKLVLHALVPHPISVAYQDLQVTKLLRSIASFTG